MVMVHHIQFHKNPHRMSPHLLCSSSILGKRRGGGQKGDSQSSKYVLTQYYFPHRVCYCPDSPDYTNILYQIPFVTFRKIILGKFISFTLIPVPTFLWLAIGHVCNHYRI
jgi:hypothetical protein